MSFIVLGATGHVGSAVVQELLNAGERVTAVIRDRGKAQVLQNLGAALAEIDVRDTLALRSVFQKGKRAFLLNPPAPVSSNIDVEERRTAAAIVEALHGSGLELVVAQSTYGAQSGRSNGDLGVLFEFEKALEAQPIPVTVQRGAYYMSNWDGMLEAARGGVLPSMFPADFRLPMVAPRDLGRQAAEALMSDRAQTKLFYTEGPKRYTPADVADAFGSALKRTVKVIATPPDGWMEAFQKIGFSDKAARSYAKMTEVTLQSEGDWPENAIRGAVGLKEYVQSVVSLADRPNGLHA